MNAGVDPEEYSKLRKKVFENRAAALWHSKEGKERTGVNSDAILRQHQQKRQEFLALQQKLRTALELSERSVQVIPDRAIPQETRDESPQEEVKKIALRCDYTRLMGVGG